MIRRMTWVFLFLTSSTIHLVTTSIFIPIYLFTLNSSHCTPTHSST